MTYSSDGLGQRSLDLVRQNASTLEYLALTDDQESVFSSLITSPDGSAVAYPHLHTLNLFGGSFGSDGPRPISNGHILFPRLCSLHLRCCYPFGDDIMFRGNSATLKCLELFLDATTVSILKRHNVFTPVSHPMLQCIKLEANESLIPDSFATATEAMRFMQTIGPEA
ncbi:hypothetical protein IWW38_005225, partial [Coemansia aciculifera]